jgi:large conductance mechanosensitive channel
VLTEFRKFVLRGNVLDLAVAVIIGAAFGAVVTSLVKDVLTPLIAAVVGQPDFSGLSLTIGESQILYGAFLNTVISLLFVAAALFFFLIKPLNLMLERMQRQEAVAPTTRECPECLSEIPIRARRCAHCTAVLSGEGAPVTSA